MAEAVITEKTDCTLNDAVDSLLAKLDNAIDDLENGRVISEEEMWAYLDAI